MGQIVCYGDSNTWGYHAETGERLPREKRWTGILQQLTGPEAVVAEEGMCGRTAVLDDPLGRGRNGREALYVCLSTHMPVDLLVLMLGTNDVKSRFSLSAQEITQGISLLLGDARSILSMQQGGVPPVLVIAPVPVSPETQFAEFLPDGPEISKRLPAHIRQLAKEQRALFLDASKHARVDPADGVHLSEESQYPLAEAVLKIWKEI